MLSDSGDMAIVSTIIQLGHTLGIGIVAEGVETAEHVQWLRQAGCDVAQGFYFSKSVAPRVIEQSWFSKVNVARR